MAGRGQCNRGAVRRAVCSLLAVSAWYLVAQHTLTIQRRLQHSLTPTVPTRPSLSTMGVIMPPTTSPVSSASLVCWIVLLKSLRECAFLSSLDFYDFWLWLCRFFFFWGGGGGGESACKPLGL